jgi:hypothetical protein
MERYGPQLTRREEEELFRAIITGYLRDKIDLEIYPKGIAIRMENSGKEIFFPFNEHNERDPRYPEE